MEKELRERKVARAREEVIVDVGQQLDAWQTFDCSINMNHIRASDSF